MKKKYDAKLFGELVDKEVKRISDEVSFPEIFYAAIEDGKQTRKQYQKLEYKKFDEDFIVNIETFIPSLDKITRNLRSALKYETEILPIEKTRRTNPESIRHLMQNTRYIRDVDDNEGVIPEKVLNTLSEIEYGIYENRFIMTLIVRLNEFLLNRLKVIKDSMHGFSETVFDLTNEFNLNNANYELSFKLKALEEMDSKEIDEHNLRVYERVESIYKVVSRMYYSDFMRIMLRYQKVKAPIMKTQIILKNPDFRNAYLLWLYLDRMHLLEYDLKTEIKNKRFNKAYHDDLNRNTLLFFTTIFNNSDLGSTNNKDDKVINKVTKSKKEEIEYTGNAYFDLKSYDLEPNLATEYYLKKAKQLYSKNLKEITKENTDLVDFRQILLDQYGIANQVYEYYFENNQDIDVFERLLTNNNPVKKYEEALHKYKVTRISREVKEKMYKEAFLTEEKWLKELIDLQIEARDALIERGIKETDEEIEKLLTLAKKEEILENKKIKDDNKQILNKKKESLDRQIKNLTNKHLEELKRFKEKEKMRLEKEKAKIKEKIRLDKIKLKEKALKEKEKNAKLISIRKLKMQKLAEAKLINEKKKIKKMTDNKIK